MKIHPWDVEGYKNGKPYYRCRRTYAKINKMSCDGKIEYGDSFCPKCNIRIVWDERLLEEKNT